VPGEVDFFTLEDFQTICSLLPIVSYRWCGCVTAGRNKTLRVSAASIGMAWYMYMRSCLARFCALAHWCNVDEVVDPELTLRWNEPRHVTNLWLRPNQGLYIIAPSCLIQTLAEPCPKVRTSCTPIFLSVIDRVIPSSSLVYLPTRRLQSHHIKDIYRFKMSV
jgi:hypothetical protein